MFSEAGYLLISSFLLAAFSAPLLALAAGWALRRWLGLEPGFLRLGLLCFLSDFTALGVQILGGLFLGAVRPPIRAEPVSWLANAFLLMLCFVFWLGRLVKEKAEPQEARLSGAVKSAQLFTCLALARNLILFLAFAGYLGAL